MDFKTERDPAAPAQRRFEGKSVIVTGGSSGIGQMIAVRFAREGAHVAINYPAHVEQAEETERLIRETCSAVRRHGVKDLLVKADISSEKETSRMFREVIDAFGRVDVLVNNAGIQIESDSDEMSAENFDRVLAINLRGAFLCAQQAIKHFIENGGGAIVNVSSVHEMIPKPKYIGYSVSKGGMHNLTRTLALEFARKNIRINGVGPGATVTPMNQSWTQDPEKREQVERHIPMGRAATAEEMAGVVAFLASDEAAYITGQTLFVDGGLTLYPDFRTPWSS